MGQLQALEKFLLLLLSFSFLFSPSLSQMYGNCPMITVSDLGSTTDVSSVGLAAGIVGMPVQVLKSSILCLSSGTRRSTYHSASVLIQYRCPNCNNVIIEHQFTFICDITRGWTENLDFSMTGNITATTNNGIEMKCLFCRPTFTLGNSAMHCIACNPSCQGTGLCYRGSSRERTCCSYYVQCSGGICYKPHKCVEKCPPLRIPRSRDFLCGQSFLPEFVINNNHYPAPIGDPAVYVYDPQHGSKVPLTITCPLTMGTIMWSFEEYLGSPRNVLLDNELLSGGVMVDISGSEISLTNIPLSDVSLLVCSNAVQEFTLRIAKVNPYLAVSDSTRRFVLPATTFTISLTVAYTLEGGVTTTPSNYQDLVMMVVNDGTTISGSEVGAVVKMVNPYKWNYLFNSSRLSSATIVFGINAGSSSNPGYGINGTSPVVAVDVETIHVSPYATEVKEGESFMVECIPSGSLVQIDWFIVEPNPEVEGSPTHRLISLSNNSAYIFSPPLLQHRMVVQNASAITRGGYMCLLRGGPIVNQTFIVIIRLKCPVSVAAGIVWESSFFGDIQTVRCNRIDSRFSKLLMASRACGDYRLWSDIDFSSCILTSSQEPFLLLWFAVEPSQSVYNLEFHELTKEISSNVSYYGSMPLNSNKVQVIPDSASVILVPYELPYINFGNLLVGLPILYRASLITGSQVNVEAIRSMFIRNVLIIGNTHVIQKTQNSAGVIGFQASEECECFPYQFDATVVITFYGHPITRKPIQRESLFTLSSLHQICVGGLISPCNCSVGNNITFSSSGTTLIPGEPPSCKCNHFFVGDGKHCVLDRDGDNYLGQPLSTCANLNQSLEIPIYCIKDSCPTIYNVPQSNVAPCTPRSGACPLEIDSVYGLSWGYASAGTSVTQPCGPDNIGTAKRTCQANGTWEEANVFGCLGVLFLRAVELNTELVKMDNLTFSGPMVQEIQDVLDILVYGTTATDTHHSQFPANLRATSSFVSNAVDYFSHGLGEQNHSMDATSSADILKVVSNVINTDNLPGSRQLTQIDPQSTFSRDLLSLSERYGLYLSALLENTSLASGEDSMNEMVLVTDNIALNAMVVSINNMLSDLTFPTKYTIEMIKKSKSSLFMLERIKDVSVLLPASLIRDRANNNKLNFVRVSNIIFQNLEQFLSSDLNNDSDPQKPVSVILSSQVQLQSGDLNEALSDPIILTFNTPNQSKKQNFSCVFWDFSLLDGLGRWSVVGLNKSSVTVSRADNTVVQCISSHLTSFAVLVNVAGGDDSLSLSIVTYIGVGLSLPSLIVSIMFFLSFGKEMFTRMHYFIHLNLAIAIFLAYLTFVLGIELATKNKIACQFVAAFLQYILLAMFCWMLCEGVMLYLMLVVVFSNIIEKWWFFLLLGWLPPLIFVVIGLASVPDQYGNYKNGKLEYCFLASGDGKHAIWAFTAPMLAIILINFTFLAIVLINIARLRNRENKLETGKGGKDLIIVVTTIKASVILSPLLGVTWVIGLFAISQKTEAFAWIFAILNSLLGVIFFFFHVLRNEKIWGFWKKYRKMQHSKPPPVQSNINSNTSYCHGSLPNHYYKKKIEKVDNHDDFIELKLHHVEKATPPVE